MNNRNKNSILIVDDSELQRFALAEILETEYDLHIAKNGIEAIEYVKKYLPDLILMDFIKLEMDGYQTFLEIRKSEKKIPIIFITSLDDDESEIKGLGLNAIDYISKPYNFEILKLRVHNNIQRINQLRITEEASFIDMLTNLPNRRGFDIKIRRMEVVNKKIKTLKYFINGS
ncbi:MAG: response regulator [Treponema sp.]|nr:response regulator [Treponema sp.]